MSVESARYAIGIDLGTTTCALSYVDLLDPDLKVQRFQAIQWEQHGRTNEHKSLPSFIYMPPKTHWKKGQLNLPFHPEATVNQFALGEWARQEAITQSEYVIHSAKSWLCHSGIDREAKILPFHSNQVVGDDRFSPIEASACYLEHFKKQWDWQIGKHSEEYSFEKQCIVITLPASFDESARRLTLKACGLANFPKTTYLLEEPQAAFYAWCNHGAENILQQGFQNSFVKHLKSKLPEQQANQPQNILVCDIGGGTSDFSLFKLHQNRIKRDRVSHHILLGGDNIDLHIATVFEKKLNRKLDSKQWQQLVHQARLIKEQILNGNHPEEIGHISITGSGARIFGGSLSLEYRKEELEKSIIESFFPECLKGQIAQRNHAALKEWGLPYADDPAITHHLAEFIGTDSVDAILFTGGTMIPKVLQNRIIDLISSWQIKKVECLKNEAMELAVSQGAAIYSASICLKQQPIESGYPRSLYILARDLEKNQNQAICIVQKDQPFNTPIRIEVGGLRAKLGEPVLFHLGSSSKLTKLSPGQVLEAHKISDLELLPALKSKLTLGQDKLDRKHSSIPIELKAELSETGLLEIYCHSCKEIEGKEHRWSLEFEVKAQLQTQSENGSNDCEEGLLIEKNNQKNKPWHDCQEAIGSIYGKPSNKQSLELKPNQLSKQLEKILAQEKQDWSMNTARKIFDLLKKGETKRSRSQQHENAWLNISGYALRPGFGDELDSFRIDQAWGIFERGLFFPQAQQVKDQLYIYLRRIAGGLDKKKQEKIWAKVFPQVFKGQGTPEMLLLIGSLERVDTKKRMKFAQFIMDQLRSQKIKYLDQKVWALGRLLTRTNFYAGSETIIRPETTSPWIKDFIHLKGQIKIPAKLSHQVLSQAGRRVGSRDLDVDPDLRREIIDHLQQGNADDDLIAPLQEIIPMSKKEQDSLFGESLPLGLLIQ